MSSVTNHFEALYPINTRETEIAKIAGFLREGNSCQLIGLPGVGRSTVLRLLSYNHEIRTKNFDESKNIHFVLVNFSEIRKKELIDAAKLLFLSLIDSLQARKMEKESAKIEEIFAKSMKLSDELVLLQGFKSTVDYLVKEEQMSLVLLFDRFDEYVPMLTQDFFTYLRTLQARARFQFSVVFSLPRPLDQLIEPSLFADYYEYVAGHTIFMNLKDEAGMMFRLKYLEEQAGKRLGKENLEELINLTGGFGKLLKVAAEALLVREKGTSEIPEYLLSMRTVRGSLFEIWYSLNPEEQEVILHPENTSEAATYLSHVGLLKEGKIQIPLLFTFANEKDSSKKEEKITYDEKSNKITKGDFVLSDLLTRAEFHLLRYLLSHSDQITDREEIIPVVWPEIKSTAGVSDQAVDQLIFRLRKKIEENPNSPTHLLTVKGRGLKFSP